MKTSCIIRTLNEGDFIGRLIESLRAQKSFGTDTEIIVVDSGSTDATVEIAKSRKVKLIQIKKEEFNYSGSLNLGIKHSTGEIIVILSGHSIPVGNMCLKKMVSRFEDADVAGVYCRQIPWPNANIDEITRLKHAFGANSKTFNSSRQSDRMHFSNAASCIRREVWKKHPFVVLPAAEDAEWACWALRAGYKIVYDASAEVCHSHSDSCRKAARRVIELEKSADIIHNRKRTVLLIAKQSLGWFIRDIRQAAAAKVDNQQKLKYLKNSVMKCFWYAYDFKRI